MDSTVSTGAAALMAVRVLLVGPQICIQVMRRWIDILLSVFSWRTTTWRRTRSSCCLCSWRRWVSTQLPTPSPGSALSPPPWTRRSTSSSTSFQASVRTVWSWEQEKAWITRRFSSLHVSSGNFGDRYFGTDAPSDWCESDEGMDYWRLMVTIETEKRAIIPHYLKTAEMLVVDSNPDYSS